MRLQSEAEGENLPCEVVEDWYDGTTGEGARQDALLTNSERTAEDTAEEPIACHKSKVWQFRAPQLETPDIGQSNSDGVWAIGRRTATLREEPVAMDRSAKGKENSTSLPTLAPETMTVGARYPHESLEEEDGGVKSRIALKVDACRGRRKVV